MQRLLTLILAAILLTSGLTWAGAKPAEASHIGTGSYATTTAYLNLRSGASTSYSVQTVIPNGGRVYIHSGPYNGHWYRVTYNGITGYSHGNWLSQSTSSDDSRTGTYATTTAYLNMRSGASTSYNVIRVIPSGARVYVNSGPYNNGWYRVTYSGSTGYSYGSYLSWGSSGSDGSSTSKLVVVDLSDQYVYAYRNSNLVLSSPVTTGSPSTPTPTGNFQVMARLSPYRFVSYYSPGHPYYYEPFTAEYAIRFRSGGYYLHHAPYRTNYGPGTNLNGNGSLGCVNVPLSAIEQLYYFVDIGTPIRVQQ